MARAHSKSALTANEKAIVKSLLNAGERNQDIHALVNVGREATVNFGRITTLNTFTRQIELGFKLLW